MKPSRIFLYFCLMFIFGVGIGSFFSIPYFWLYLGFLAVVVLAALFPGRHCERPGNGGEAKQSNTRCHPEAQPKDPLVISKDSSLRFASFRMTPLFLLFLGFIFLLLGIFRYQISIPKIDQNQITFYNGKNLTFQGVIVDEPDERINHVKYTIGRIDVSPSPSSPFPARGEGGAGSPQPSSDKGEGDDQNPPLKVRGVEAKQKANCFAFCSRDGRSDAPTDVGAAKPRTRGVMSYLISFFNNSSPPPLNLRGGTVIRGRLLLSAPLYPKYHYGDLLEISCELKKPEPFSDFSYDRYLERFDIYSTCFYPQIKLISQNQGNLFFQKVLSFKETLKVKINSHLPEPQASIFSAIALGSRRGVPQDLKDKFSITGISHLLAISGLHITIIITLLMSLLINLYIPRKRAFYIISAILPIYLILIGLPASAIRAGIMGWLVILAMQIGRLRKAGNAIVLAAAIMILINPKILRDDIGFQLSFLAVLGIIYFYPLLNPWFKNWPKTLGIRDLVPITLAAQIATLPLIVYNFGRLSLIAPAVNILVIPILPYLLIFGFLALGLIFILPFFWQLIFFPVWLILSYLIKTIEIFAAFPLAALEFEKKAILVPVFLAGLVVYVYFKLKKRGGVQDLSC